MSRVLYGSFSHYIRGLHEGSEAKLDQKVSDLDRCLGREDVEAYKGEIRSGNGGIRSGILEVWFIMSTERQ